MKKFLLIITLLFLIGCDSIEPIETNSVGKNNKYKVEFLFEQDGVRVYRFDDYGYSRYFTTKGDTSWQEHHGKTTRPVEIEGAK